jgi:hypothetical protein
MHAIRWSFRLGPSLPLLLLAMTTRCSRPEFLHTSETVGFILDFATGVMACGGKSSNRDQPQACSRCCIYLTTPMGQRQFLRLSKRKMAIFTEPPRMVVRLTLGLLSGSLPRALSLCSTTLTRHTGHLLCTVGRGQRRDFLRNRKDWRYEQQWRQLRRHQSRRAQDPRSDARDDDRNPKADAENP